MKKLLNIALVICFALLAQGCASKPDAASAWDQLRGTNWSKDRKGILFPQHSMHGYLIYNDGNFKSVQIHSISANKVTFSGGSFNFAVSGNSLTVSNWSIGSEAVRMNGVYTKDN